MAGAVERWRSEINSLIDANEQAAMSQAEGYVERLEQELMELQHRDMELRQILETEDNIHFLQVDSFYSCGCKHLLPVSADIHFLQLQLKIQHPCIVHTNIHFLQVPSCN